VSGARAAAASERAIIAATAWALRSRIALTARARSMHAS
jgi:hypothetical protein